MNWINIYGAFFVKNLYTKASISHIENGELYCN